MSKCLRNSGPKIDFHTLTCSQALAVVLCMEAQKNKTQLQLIVYGTAGSGKTHLINAIKQACTGVLCMAPTGMAALLIGGVTYQSAIPVRVNNQRTWPQLPKNVLARYQEQLKDINTLIVDEMSMLSCGSVGWLDKRTREIRDANKPFGGFGIVFAGDFGQLVPCGGVFILHTHTYMYVYA